MQICLERPSKIRLDLPKKCRHLRDYCHIYSSREVALGASDIAIWSVNIISLASLIDMSALLSGVIGGEEFAGADAS